MARAEITDTGGKNQCHVTEDGELHVISSPYPAFFEQKVQPFRQYLTADGTSSGSNDMAVDGSATNVDFYVSAHATDDRYITAMNFLVAYGAAGSPYLWADGVALTNGSRFFYENRTGEHNIHDAIKINQDLFRLTFNVIQPTWEVRHTNALNDYGYFISMDLTKMGLPFGIKLDAGTKQRLVMCVRDNTGTDADTFNAIAYGFDRFQ